MDLEGGDNGLIEVAEKTVVALAVSKEVVVDAPTVVSAPRSIDALVEHLNGNLNLDLQSPRLISILLV